MNVSIPVTEDGAQVQRIHAILRTMVIRNTGDWSGPYWFVDHLYAARFPEHPTEAQRQDAVQFYQTHFPTTLPCAMCTGHFKQFAAQVYPHTVSRAALFAWTVAQHNALNKKNGLPQLTVEEAAAVMTRPDQSTAALRAANQCVLHAYRTKTDPGACAAGIAAAMQSGQLEYSSSAMHTMSTATVSVVWLVLAVCLALVLGGVAAYAGMQWWTRTRKQKQKVVQKGVRSTSGSTLQGLWPDTGRPLQSV